MKPFPDPVRLKDAGMRGSSRVFSLLRDFRYYSPKHGVITVPKGFKTDGASVPRVFWGLFDPFGPWFPAALVHDFLYSRVSDAFGDFNRAIADRVFLDAMTDAGVDSLRRRIIYMAVRVGGGLAYKSQPKINHA